MIALPRFLVVGGPVPGPLREGLAGNVAFATDTDPAQAWPDGFVVYAGPDALATVRRLRGTGADLPIYVWSGEPAEISARIQWIRDGADDLLTPENGASVLLRRARGEADRPATHPDVGARVDRYLEALQRYVNAREDLVRSLGVGGRSRWLDCAYRRDQVMRASETDAPPDALGQRRGSDREALEWPADVMAPYAAPCVILNIGPDGMCLSLPRSPTQGQQLRVEVEGASSAVRVDLEVRWQRRVAKDRWEAGALAVACQRTRAPGGMDPGRSGR
jgi:hypothetical protein